MKHDRLVLTAGFMPAVVMAALLLLERAAQGGLLQKDLPGTLLAGVAVYGIPTLFLRLATDGEGKRTRFRFQGYKRQTGWFVLWMSLTAAVLAVAVGCAVALTLDRPYAACVFFQGVEAQVSWPLVLVPALVTLLLEELFFRGVLFGALERGGTWPALILSSAAFALVRGSPQNLPGLLVLGLLLGYLTYVLGSVWPAIFAHGVYDLLALTVARGAKTYTALGIWQYIFWILAFCFCLFLALAMRALETQMEKGRIRRLQYQPLTVTAANIFMSPGIWLLALLFALRVMY